VSEERCCSDPYCVCKELEELKKKAWPKRWEMIRSLVQRMGHEDELIKLLERKYRCSRCGRNDLPLALFFAHEKSCAYEVADDRSVCMLLDEITNLNWELETVKMELKSHLPAPPKTITIQTEYRCDRCKGLFDSERMRYIPNGITCEWCYRHLP
jgi:hypothetical protein